jgi:hypothetical protein
LSSSASAPACAIRCAKIDPAARRRAVQRRDDRHAHRGLHAPEVLEVLLRPEHEVLRVGEPVARLGERLGRHVERARHRELLVDDLLLERATAARRAARPRLEPAHAVEVVGERTGAGHDRVGEGEAEVARGESMAGSVSGRPAARDA